jgi:hypothetical protein
MRHFPLFAAYFLGGTSRNLQGMSLEERFGRLPELPVHQEGEA